MKKILTLFIIFLTTLFSFTNNQSLLVNAASVTTTEEIINKEIISKEIIPLDDSYYMEVITYDTTFAQANTASTTATTYTKSPSKTHNIKNAANNTLVSYTLYATFTYNGSTSSCTSVSYSTTVYDSTWCFTSATASRSGNKATGSYTAKCPTLGQTVSNTITITCDANGNIS